MYHVCTYTSIPGITIVAVYVQHHRQIRGYGRNRERKRRRRHQGTLIQANGTPVELLRFRIGLRKQNASSENPRNFTGQDRL